MEKTECIFCNSRDNPVVIEENGFRARRCVNCGLIYVWPRPDPGKIAGIYENDRAHMAANSHISSAGLPRLYEKHHLKILRRYARGGRLLEIGAGSGSFLDQARKRRFKVFAIEPNRIQADFIKRSLGIPCEEAQLCAGSFGDMKFDIIFHRDVTSHFYDPIAEFANMNAKLAAGGILVFETGFYGEDGYIKLFPGHQLPDHLFTLSDTNLRQLLERTGFKVRRIYRYSSIPWLLLNRPLAPAMAYIKQGKKYSFNKAPAAAGPADGGKRKEPFFVAFLRVAYLYLSHFLRYKAGYFYPKGGGPQKVIIIAEKNER